MNSDNGLSAFASGFSSSAPVDAGPALWIILAFAAGLGLLWYLNNQAQKNRKKSGPAAQGRPRPRVTTDPDPDDLASAAPALLKVLPKADRLNPLQQTMIHEMIDEFRKQEPLAQAVPSAVLEKYSEFFFAHSKQLKTHENEVREFVDHRYPLQVGQGVELDFHASGVMHLMKTTVLEVAGKTLTVAFQEPIPAFVKRGATFVLNYSVGKHFLQGPTTILDLKRNVGIVLRKPVRTVLTGERRYARVTLRPSPGVLQDRKSGHQTPVQVLDLSFEGVRVQVQKPLVRNQVYQLTFETAANGQPWSFGPLECVPSKAFLTGTGTYEAGLGFLYLDLGAKTKLQEFMKNLSIELQRKRAAAGS